MSEAKAAQIGETKNKIRMNKTEKTQVIEELVENWTPTTKSIWQIVLH